MAVVLGYESSPGAERALAAAIEVAAGFGDGLVVVFASGVPGGLGEEAGAMRTAIEERGRAALDHAIAQADAAGVPSTVEVVDAKPAEALLEVAERHDARVIVVGTWGESPLRGAMLGSTPHKLLHLSRRPVLCVPAAD